MTDSKANKEPKTALIRVDGSQHLGLGHIMRCLAFARGLGEANKKTVFVIRDYEPSVTELIRQHKYDVGTIPQDCGFTEDASLTLQFANRYAARLIITDIGNTSVVQQPDAYTGYLQNLKGHGPFLITIDDLSTIPFPSAIVINANHGAETMDYQINGHTRFLLGSDYFIFREEFRKAAGVDRKIIWDARKILITLGSNAPLDLMVKVTRALKRSTLAAELNLRIVMGINSPGATESELDKTIRGFTGNCEIIRASNDMAGQMLWADLAITADGQTKYEAALTGTPTIIIARAEYKSKVAAAFEKRGTALHLGHGERITEETILEAVDRLLRDHNLRNEMSRNGRGLLDGRGIERIIAAIPGEVWA